MRVVINPFAVRGPYQGEEAQIVSFRHAETALVEIAGWPGYTPTPLRSLRDLARDLGVHGIHYKDESQRFGQGSFKPLGGAYAVALKMRQLSNRASVTLCCATDGNHGRAIAYAAQRHGCRCIVFMHENAPASKSAAIRSLGAEVIRTPGTYDDSVRQAHAVAAAQGWILIPDTSNDPSDPTTRTVMQGYGVLVLEILSQLENRPPPTHVFLQGGVGGFAAAIAGVFADVYGRSRPTVIVVEPETAACLFESAVRFVPSRAPGDLKTAMEMLSTGEASAVAWPILQSRADVFMTIDDQSAILAMHRLVSSSSGVPGLDVGVSGAAGLAGLIELRKNPGVSRLVGLGETSSVLTFGTEGATTQANEENSVGFP